MNNRDRTRERPRPVDIDGRRWRPERTTKKHIYKMLDLILDLNPNLKASQVFDMALAGLFGREDSRSQKIFEADLLRFDIRFPSDNGSGE